jgi:hypothetical protein
MMGGQQTRRGTQKAASVYTLNVIGIANLFVQAPVDANMKIKRATILAYLIN